MFCKKCGMQLNDNVKFCQNCGAPIPQQENVMVNGNQDRNQNINQNGNQNRNQNANQNPKKGKGFFLILLLVILIVAVICLGVVIWNISKTNQANNLKNDNYSDTVLEDEKEEDEKEEDSKGESSNGEESASKEEDAKNDKFTVSKDESVTEEAIRGTKKENGSELSDRNYEEIIRDLRNCEKVHNADKTTMMTMINALLGERVIGCDEKVCFNQLSNEDAQFYALMLIHNSNLEIEPEYVDDTLVYSKEEINKAVWDFYYGKNIQWKTDVGVEDKGDYIEITFGDGDPWYILNSCDIKQNGDFYLLSGPCFYGDNGGTEDILEFYIDAVFEKNEKSRFGLTLCYAETYKNEKKPQSITATSKLADYQDKSYGAEKMMDGNTATPWVEGVDGTGVGEQIIISLPEGTKVHGILLYNGYLETDDLHTKNGTVTRVSVDFGNGVVVEEEVFDPTYSVQYPNPSRVELEQSVKTDKIVITILDAKSGTKYDDTCIGEIIVF